MVEQDIPGKIFGNVYKAVKKIGSGTFGEIYIGTDIKTNKNFALKLESVYSPHRKGDHEAGIYKELAGVRGIPAMRWYGRTLSYNTMVIDLMGPSLEDLFNYCGRKFSLKTVVMIAEQLITRIEHIHSKGYIHRDLKPDNLVVGTGANRGVIYVIDFGLAKRVKIDNVHIPDRSDKSMTGTARYTSINSHRGKEMSRRDDLEVLGYIFIYFLKGKLPWQGLGIHNDEDKEIRIYRHKKNTSVESLCEDLEPEFSIFLNYARSLNFADRPNYAYLRLLFKSLSQRMDFKDDFMFDWTIKKLSEEAAAEAKVKLEKEKREAEKKIAKPPADPTLPAAKKQKKTPLKGPNHKTAEEKKELINIVCQYHQQKMKKHGHPNSDKSLKPSPYQQKKELINIVCEYHQQGKEKRDHPNSDKPLKPSPYQQKKELINIVCEYHQQRKEKPDHPNSDKPLKPSPHQQVSGVIIPIPKARGTNNKAVRTGK